MKKALIPGLALALAAAPAFAADMQYVLRIDGITCPFCVATSEKALKKIDGVKSVSSNLKAGTITVCADDEKVKSTDDQLAALFKEKGFTYRSMEVTGACPA
jgi:mercuric ion binding protein